MNLWILFCVWPWQEGTFPSPAEVVDLYLNKTPLTRFYPGDMDTALVFQRDLVAALKPHLGPVYGYKAALTSPPARARFGVDQPLLGFLLRDMLRPNGARLPLAFGARPLAEADLMVRVAHDSINQASNRAEVLSAIDAVIPFIELPDAIFSGGVTMSGPALVAVNAGARYGVMGEAISVGGQDWMGRLARFEVVLNHGARSVEGKGTFLMGHPLQAVLWIRDALKSEGLVLRRGDLLSLGSLTPPVVIDRPGIVTAVYRGLGDEDARVTVVLE